MLRPHLKPIHRGQPYMRRASDGPGCVLKHATADGLLICTGDGEELIPAAEVEAKLRELKARKRP